MKRFLQSLALIAGLLIIHAIPALAVAILPSWVLIISAVLFATALTVTAFWAFVQALEIRSN